MGDSGDYDEGEFETSMTSPTNTKGGGFEDASPTSAASPSAASPQAALARVIDEPAAALEETPPRSPAKAAEPAPAPAAASPLGDAAECKAPLEPFYEVTPPPTRQEAAQHIHFDEDSAGARAMPSAQRAQPRARSSPGLGSPPQRSASLTLAGLSASMGSAHSTKPPPHCALLSHVKTGPAFSIGSKTASGGIFRSSTAPGPGSYNLQTNTGDKMSKYTSMPRFSFGGASRFGLGENPMKEKPGPGHYGNPRDPGLERSARTSFGGSVRPDMAKKVDGPGPGAYELKSTVGDGKMFTAGGRHYGSTGRSRMMPGPGAYDPSDRLDSKFTTTSKVGFGTATREDFAAKREAGKPGPGAYEMQNAKGLGVDGPKFSIRSRRRQHDLNSYIEPGPGHYASHDTSFGGAGMDGLFQERPKSLY